MNKVQQFIHEVFGKVRIIPSESGNQTETLFCATDVARVLEYKNPKDAIIRHCGDGVVFHDIIDSLGRTQSAKFINLQGVFALSFGSHMKEAQKFRDWICNDILPTLYQYGTVTLDNHEDNPQFTNPIYEPNENDFNDITNKENQYGYHEKENIEVPPHLERMFNREYKEMSFEDKRQLYAIFQMIKPIFQNQQVMYNEINQLKQSQSQTQYVNGKHMIIPAVINKKGE